MFVELISYDVTQFFWPIVPSAYSAALIVLPEIENLSLSTNVATCLSGSPKMNAVDLIFYSTFLLRLSYLTNSVSLSPLLSNLGSRPTGWEENSEVPHILRLKDPPPQKSISVPGQSSGISLSWVGVSALPTPDPPWETRSGPSSHLLCTMVWYEGPTISSNRTFPDSQEIYQIFNKQHTLHLRFPPR